MRQRISVLHSGIILFSFILITACGDLKNSANKKEQAGIAYGELKSLNALEKIIDSLSQYPDSLMRNQALNQLWDSLQGNNDLPFVRDDSVIFLYRGKANQIQYAGDFTGWYPNPETHSATKVDSFDLWMLKLQFPADARLDYKVVVNGETWQLDPFNNYVQYSGFGPNSELRMGAWEQDPITIPIENVSEGNLSEYKRIHSELLAYTLQYQVYTPIGYEKLNELPVLYITDGNEYVDPRLGNTLTVLNNLIHNGSIDPIIAVFVDPRNPNNLNENRRVHEYSGNIKYANFLADELVPEINANYKTSPLAKNTALMGTSLGGWNTTFTGFSRPDVFNLLAIHSPAYKEEAIFQLVKNADKYPFKLFLSTGVINDTEHYANPMYDILLSKGYAVNYVKVNEGHSWGNWRALLDEPLIQFFGSK